MILLTPLLIGIAGVAVTPLQPSHAGVLDLDGVDSYVTFTNPGGLIPTGDSSFTIEAWINPTSIPAGGGAGGQITFWGNQAGGESNGFRMASEDGLNHYFWGNDHGIDPAPAGDMTLDTGGPNSDGWHHVAITYDSVSNSSTWYQNGDPISTLIRVNEPSVANANFQIGARLAGDEDFHGQIDEIRIWDTVRGDAEIEANYDKELPPDTSGLVAYFKFDGAVPDFADATGNGHGGTAVGLATTDAALNAPVEPLQDSDIDGLPDDWEMMWFDDLDQGPGDDPDNDGLTNAEELEFSRLLDPDDPDTDDDTINDGDEVNGTLNPYVDGTLDVAPGDPTDPLEANSDGDTLDDGHEISVSGTDPNDPDTDDDAVPDDADPDPLDPNIPGAPPGFGALSLDGVSFAEFNNDNPDARIPTGDEPFTIEAWVNPTTIPAGGLNGGQITFWGTEGPQDNANGFRLRGSDMVRHYFWGNDHDESIGIDILPDDTGVADPSNGGNPSGWHHFALTYDGLQTAWYWNGVPLGNPRAVSGVSVADANFLIGKRPTGEFFDGWIDEVRIWNVARSSDDIASDFGTELGGNESGLVAYWNFTGGSLGDATGNGHDATPMINAAIDRNRNAPVGSAAKFEITQIDYDPATRTSTITWRSRPAGSYAVFSKTDLEGEWNELNDAVLSMGEATSYQHVAPEGTTRLFYFVRDVTP